MNEEKIKDVVHNILKKDSRARNNDKFLVLETLRHMGFKVYIDYEDLEVMPSFETITRSRRFIQNELGECLPTPEVDQRRTEQEEYNKRIWKNGGWIKE